VLLREDDVVWNFHGAAPRTSTYSVATPDRAWRQPHYLVGGDMTSLSRKLLKPLASTETLYRPGMRLRPRTFPADVVVTLIERLSLGW